MGKPEDIPDVWWEQYGQTIGSNEPPSFSHPLEDTYGMMKKKLGFWWSAKGFMLMMTAYML